MEPLQPHRARLSGSVLRIVPSIHAERVSGTKVGQKPHILRHCLSSSVGWNKQPLLSWSAEIQTFLTELPTPEASNLFLRPNN